MAIFHGVRITSTEQTILSGSTRMQKSDIQDHKPFFSNAATPETEATNLPRTSDSHSCHSGFLIHGFLHDRAATELKWLDETTPSAKSYDDWGRQPRMKRRVFK
jgi:hypothetical protein